MTASGYTGNPTAHTQAISTVTGLQAALDAKADAVTLAAYVLVSYFDTEFDALKDRVTALENAGP